MSQTRTMTYAEFTRSRWLREAIEASKQRDIVDALRDAEALVAILRDRYAGVVQR